MIAFSGRSVTAADVATVLGLSDTTFFARIAALIADGDHGGILEALDEASETGRDFKMLYRDLLSFMRNLLLVALGVFQALSLLPGKEHAVNHGKIPQDGDYPQNWRHAIR